MTEPPAHRRTEATEIGGPSEVIAPEGEVVMETAEHLTAAILGGAAVGRAHGVHPEHLPSVRPVHADG